MEKPQKPLTGYIKFNQDLRPHMQRVLPTTSSKDVARLTGLMWKSLPDTVKQAYKREYEDQKAKYDAEAKKRGE